MEGLPMCSFQVKSIIHDYKVLFIDDFEKSLKEELKEGDFIIIDNKVLEIYQNKLDSAFSKYKVININATEVQKSYTGVIPIINSLVSDGFKKNHRLFAIGGGITQDTTAFIASILYRGVNWIFYPTTLLAQADSCIGSKTSINFDQFKNQLGGFYPPNKILIDPAFINSLTKNEILSGLGEMLHYFIIGGPNDFKLFSDLYILSLQMSVNLTRLINRSLQIKKSYIEIDEFDKNERQIFNYGHSFGHAIESLTHYAIPHGIAVAFGIDIANFIAVQLGLLKESTRNDIKNVVRNICDGYDIRNIEIDVFINALSKDKKNVGSKFGLILCSDYGEVKKYLIDHDAQFKTWLTLYFENEFE
jgi:3-dehydroquinate synthase